MVTVTVTGTANEVLAEMERLCNLHSVTVGATTIDLSRLSTDKPKVEKVEKPAKAEKAEKAATPALAQTSTVVLPTPPPKVDLPPAVVGTPVTLEDVRAIGPKVMAVAGREATVALLATFGATKGSEVKPEDFAKFIDAANAVIASATAGK